MLPQVQSALAKHAALVLVAPPGAGKTTRVPPALLGQSWLNGKVCMLQPRRVAARAAAARIAHECGWTVGQTVGYQIRFERCVSKATRIEILTEGVLTRRVQRDPSLDGIGAVIFDEFHERNLHADVGLALLKEVQQSLRPDLRLIVMSATMEPAPVARYLGTDAVIKVETRPHPIEHIYALRKSDSPLAQRCASTIKRAFAEDTRYGDILAFLPGVAEIDRIAAQLEAMCGVRIISLHGRLPSEAQDRGLAAATDSRRVVLSTNVAETSVTVQGVTTVVDSGLVRQLRNDPRTGLDRLELTTISKASADQRAGRAARTGPGRVYRMWTEGEQVSLPTNTPAEIRRVDLARTVLELRAWGADPLTFDWFDAPPPTALSNAEILLIDLGALDARRRITDLGKRLLAFPLHPRLARILIDGVRNGYRKQAATIVAILAERDIIPVKADPLPTARSDVLSRVELFELCLGAGQRPWSTINRVAVHRVRKVRDALLRPIESAGAASAAREPDADETMLLASILSGYPDRVVVRRRQHSAEGVMVGGRGVRLSQHSAVRDADYYVAIDVEGSGRNATVRVASEIDPDWLDTQNSTETTFDAETKRAVGYEIMRYRDLVIRRCPAAPDATLATTLLAEAALADLDNALGWDKQTKQWIARLRWLAQVSPELALPRCTDADLSKIVAALCSGKTSFSELQKEPLIPWLEGLLTPTQRCALETQAPRTLPIPSGKRLPLEYRENAAPIFSVKLQLLFGVNETPTVAAGKEKVLLHLLAPNGRPVQVTDDLSSFWKTTYAEVRKQLRARYPKHAWPETPY